MDAVHRAWGKEGVLSNNFSLIVRKSLKIPVKAPPPNLPFPPKTSYSIELVAKRIEVAYQVRELVRVVSQGKHLQLS